MQTKLVNGLPAEYLKLIEEAESLEFDDTIEAKRLYLKAAKFLMELSAEEPVLSVFYRREALRAYQLYVKLEKKYGRSVPTSAYRVVSPFENGRGSGFSLTGIGSRFGLASVGNGGIGFSSIHGLDELKEEIALKILLPLKDPAVLDTYKKSGKSGILMYGPPGCGKSMVAEAIANEIGVAFFHVKSSDYLSKWIGETEKNLSQIFEKAKAQQQSIIFIDEFESVGRDRSAIHNSFEKNFVSQLLKEMDGLGTKNNRIIVIAATNEPWEIDSALLRSGRLGTRLFVGPPNLATRTQLLKSEIKKRPCEPDLQIDELASMARDFSGADLVQMCDSAAEEAIKHYLNTKELRKITLADFNTALKKIKPVTRAWFSKAKMQITQRHLEQEYPEILKYDVM